MTLAIGVFSRKSGSQTLQCLIREECGVGRMGGRGR